MSEENLKEDFKRHIDRITNLAKAICDYFPLLVEENKRLQQELQRKDNIIKDTKEVLLTTNNIEKALNILDRIK